MSKPFVSIDGIFQARIGSSRLRGKVMMPVLGKPLLYYMVERVTASKHLMRLVVATSKEKEDDVIEEFCLGNNIAVFRGSETDVLDRLYQCAKKYSMKHVARFCGDNPLIDPAIIDKVLTFYIENINHYDYVSNNHPPTWPDGQEVEVMPFHMLEIAWRESKEPFQREHGTPYIWDNPELFRIGNVESPEYLYSKYRWTLDYKEDFDFIREVFERLYRQVPKGDPVPLRKSPFLKKVFTMQDIFALLRDNPELTKINEMHKGCTWYEKEKNKLRTIKQ